MNTATAKAKDKRENAQGRKYYTTFLSWVGDKEVPTPDMLMLWDTKHNQSRFRKLYIATDTGVYEAGLKAIYTRILANWSFLVIKNDKGKSIKISPFRQAGKNGYKVNITNPDLQIDDLEFIRTKAKLTAKNAAERLRVFKLTLEEVIEIFTEAAEEAYK